MNRNKCFWWQDKKIKKMIKIQWDQNDHWCQLLNPSVSICFCSTGDQGTSRISFSSSTTAGDSIAMPLLTPCLSHQAGNWPPWLGCNCFGLFLLCFLSMHLWDVLPVTLYPLPSFQSLIFCLFASHLTFCPFPTQPWGRVCGQLLWRFLISLPLSLVHQRIFWYTLHTVTLLAFPAGWGATIYPSISAAFKNDYRLVSPHLTPLECLSCYCISSLSL